MKIVQSIIAIQLLTIMTAVAQSNETVSISKDFVVKVLNDEELNRKTPVSVNHEKYQNKLMKLILQEDYKTILRICNKKEFSSFMYNNDNQLGRTKNPSEILPVLKSIKDDFPNFFSLFPESVTEEFVLNDVQRAEIWNYSDKNGIPRSFSVIYYNDQILCIAYL